MQSIENQFKRVAWLIALDVDCGNSIGSSFEGRCLLGHHIKLMCSKYHKY